MLGLMLGFESLDFATKFVILAALVVGFVVFGWVISPKRDKVKKIKTESELFSRVNDKTIRCNLCKTILFTGGKDAHAQKHRKDLKQ